MEGHLLITKPAQPAVEANLLPRAFSSVLAPSRRTLSAKGRLEGRVQALLVNQVTLTKLISRPNCNNNYSLFLMRPQLKTLRVSRLATHLAIILEVVQARLTTTITVVETNRMLSTPLLSARDSSTTPFRAKGFRSIMSATTASTWTSRRNLSSPSFSRAEVLEAKTVPGSSR